MRVVQVPIVDLPHVIQSDTKIPDGYSRVVTRYVEIAANVTFEIGADADLEIL